MRVCFCFLSTSLPLPCSIMLTLYHLPFNSRQQHHDCLRPEGGRQHSPAHSHALRPQHPRSHLQGHQGQDPGQGSLLPALLRLLLALPPLLGLQGLRHSHPQRSRLQEVPDGARGQDEGHHRRRSPAVAGCSRVFEDLPQSQLGPGELLSYFTSDKAGGQWWWWW